jgi:hypothetical protein
MDQLHRKPGASATEHFRTEKWFTLALVLCIRLSRIPVIPLLSKPQVQQRRENVVVQRRKNGLPDYQ